MALGAGASADRAEKRRPRGADCAQRRDIESAPFCIVPAGRTSA